MKPQPSPPRVARITGIFLLVVLALTIGASSVMASAPTTSPDEGAFLLSISQSKDPICVGDAVNVVINWRPDTRPRPSSNGLEPLAPLFPLTGPDRIKLQASLGEFYPDNSFTPGSVSGTRTITYIANKEGKETILAQAWLAGGASDAIAKDSFTVKACDFYFNLHAELHLDVQGEGIAYSVRYTVKSSGILKAPGPDKPLSVEGKGKRVRLAAVVTSWSASKCTLFTYEPGTGEGSVDVRADPNPNGIGMVLQFAPPQDLAWEVAYSFACDGQPLTLAGIYPVTSGQDPWISAQFPLGSGQQRVKVDMFEIPMNKMKGSPGVSVSYTATATLEKEPPQ